MRVRRFSTRQLMIAVIVAGLLLAGMIRFGMALRYWTRHGYNTSVLPIGLEVVTNREVPTDGQLVPAGTPGIVVSDPPDEDSAYRERLVGVRIDAGQHRGTIRMIPRIDLRAR